MNIPVVWLSYDKETPARGYWDQGMIEALFAHDLWRPVGAHTYRHILSLPEKVEGAINGAVVVFPARAQVDYVDRLNADLKALDWVILVLTGDEEASFRFDKIDHPNMKVWAMSPRKLPRFENTRNIGTGWPPEAKKWLPRFKEEAFKRPDDWMFAGQITHERRHQMFEQLNVMINEKGRSWFVNPTSGFTQGVVPERYYHYLARAKTAPCPSGPQTPDSFRIFEALEAGCIPIADTRIPSDMPNDQFGDDYWTWFFGEEPPFPVLTNYEQLPGYTYEAADNWPTLGSKVAAWWIAKKRQMAYWLETDLKAVGAPEIDSLTAADMITVLIPSSPILAHPDTAMIEQCVRDVRAKLPESEIIIMLDGVRAEQEDRRADYEQYVNRVTWLCQNEWKNVMPLIFKEHSHQATMTREALKHVATPCILFVEHDAPITPDCDFDWSGLTSAVMTGEANLIRFHHEARILEEHEPLMLGPVEQICGAPMRKTYQWSQRPHLASIAFYRQFLDNYFNPESRTMIEDVMHGAVIEAVRRDGILGWQQFRLWIYTPEGNVKRSYHLDGRQTDPKYEMDIKPVERAA